MSIVSRESIMSSGSKREDEQSEGDEQGEHGERMSKMSKGRRVSRGNMVRG